MYSTQILSNCKKISVLRLFYADHVYCDKNIMFVSNGIVFCIRFYTDHVYYDKNIMYVSNGIVFCIRFYIDHVYCDKNIMYVSNGNLLLLFYTAHIN